MPMTRSAALPHPDTDLAAAIATLAAEHGIEAAALQAVVQVESAGTAFARIAGRLEPLIRFEGHYFYRQLGAQARNVAVVAGLAHPVAGRVANPRSQKGRWAMLARARSIDAEAADCSTSWGVGQVMGAHWRWLGYAGIGQLVEHVRSGIEGQVRLMTRFIHRSGLLEALDAHDWRAFARAYNGPAFERNAYDRKLAHAYRQLRGARSASPAPAAARHRLATLGLGSSGEAVLQMQLQLRRHGYALEADGDFGPATQAALRAFQRHCGLDPDGILGPRSLEMLGRLPMG